MAINEGIVFLLFLISFTPYIILGIAGWMIRSYNERLRRGEIEYRPSEIPVFVRIHIISVKTLRNCVLIYYSAYSFLFGLPLIAVYVLWPLDFYTFLNEISFWMILLGIFVFLEVGCKSPDPTGGLDIVISSSEENMHCEDVAV